ncbi:MAG: hypothetical protein FE78DRAFT_283065 [Acidomyces sp. 'richmondensis']|nr:MAG: hypothetical protein FE78DRAFT_283065 [Acidomyces sp. 'richmondensis']
MHVPCAAEWLRIAGRPQPRATSDRRTACPHGKCLYSSCDVTCIGRAGRRKHCRRTPPRRSLCKRMGGGGMMTCSGWCSAHAVGCSNKDHSTQHVAQTCRFESGVS